MSRHRVFLASLALLLMLPAVAGASEGARLIRYPDLDPTGSRIAFSYQGDIWTAGVDGQGPRRITIHEGYEAHPRWSPDGDYVAFSSNRFGNFDVFTVPFDGGMPARLTYHSAEDVVTDWSAGSSILFNSRRLNAAIEWDMELLKVDPAGGTPGMNLGAVGRDAVASPDGRFVAFIRGACRVQRETYPGPATRQVWIYDTKNDKYFQVTSEGAQHSMPRWSGERTLYYLSAAPGRYNIFSVAVGEDGTAGEARQITAFEDDGIRYFDVSEEGGVIVAEYRTGIYSMGLDGSGLKEIVVDVGTDYRFDPVVHRTFTGDISYFSPSPDGKYSAVVIHGEVFVTENHKKKNRTVNISNSPWRDDDPGWTSDSTLVFLSDREGQYDIFMAESADDEEKDLFKTLKRKVKRVTSTKEDESGLTVSPCGKKVAFVRGNGTLIVADISADGKLTGEKKLVDGWSMPSGIAWSPDGKYLAYALEDLTFDSEIYIHPVDDSSKPVNVSMHPRGDFGPVWSPDGGKLAWWSGRNNLDDDIWFVWLKKADWEKTRQDWEEEEDGELIAMDGKKDKKDKKGENGEDEEKKDEPEPVVIDFEDIHERLVQVTRLTGDERNIAITKDGKTFYFTSQNPAGDGRDLFSVKWDGTEIKQITKGGSNPGGIAFDKPLAYLFVPQRGRLSRMKAGSDKLESVAMSARLSIDFMAEREQIFEEAWRSLDNLFYDPNFHGRDWKELKEKYKPRAMMASTKHDFRDMFNIMAGQLDASHMGMYGDDRGDMQRETTGLLGVEIEQKKDGVKILRVVPGSPADRSVSKLEAGETITAVDGAPAGGKVNFYSLLTNTAGTKILLTVKDVKGKEREVAIRPTGVLENELYDEWVKGRRAFTEKESDGRLGYLHIEAMGWESFERFEREFAAAGLGKEGIVIDVRYNGGGWTTDYLMAVLNVDQHAYTIPRGAVKSLEKENRKFQDYYPYAERLPFYPWMKPSITICNENSYSNAEIFSHAYKTLDIGTLVGRPTFGAVISTGGRRLIDGALIRLPFRAWYVKATGENMEHGPAVPDIVVEDRPECKAAGTDPQLSRAIEELLRQIDSAR